MADIFSVMDVKRFHPLLGTLNMFTNSSKTFWHLKANGYEMGNIFPNKSGLVILDWDFFENLGITIKIGTTKTLLLPLYIKKLDINGVVFARGDTILFYDFVNSRWYVRFDGVPETPSNVEYTDYEGNKRFIGVPYLQGPKSLPSPLLQGEYAEISLTNYLEPEDQEKECSLIIDPTNIGYFEKSTTTSIEGIYEGKLAYKGKKMRVGWGVWKDSNDQWVREYDDIRGKIQIQGATYNMVDGKYYIGTKDDPNGWWEYDGTIEFEKDFTFTFVLPSGSNAAIQINKTFTWVGFKVYRSQQKKDALSSVKKYVCESPVWR